MNSGRLPVGVRSGQAGQAYAVGYMDTVTPVLSVDPATGAVLGVQVRWLRTVQVTVPNRGTVTAGTLLDVTTTVDARPVRWRASPRSRPRRLIGTGRRCCPR